MAEGVNEGLLLVGLLGFFALLAFFLSRPSGVATASAEFVSLERDTEGRLIGMVSSSR